MPKMTPRLQTLALELRYAFGNLYFDRCGQTLNDIEKERVGWIAEVPNTQTGLLRNPSAECEIRFSNERYNFVSDNTFKYNFDELIKEAGATWKIIKANLGLYDFLRLGCRFEYLLPTESLDDANAKLAKSPINLLMPQNIFNDDYSIRTRHVVAVLNHKDTEYRIEISSITRTQAIDPSNLVKGDPRALSKNQRKARLDILNSLSDYSANPMYGIKLDIDCFQIESATDSIEEFAHNQYRISSEEFFHMLESL